MKNLRVYIDKDKHDIYERLVKRGSDSLDDYPFATMKDVFMLAACLGAKYDSKPALESPRDIFNSDVFDERIDIPVIASLAYRHGHSLAVLYDDKQMLEIIQKFANGGISFLQQEILTNPGRPLNNLIHLLTQGS